MWASEAAKLPVLEFSLDKILAGLELTYEQVRSIASTAGATRMGGFHSSASSTTTVHT